VRAFTAIGIPYAAGAMNLVVISAAISSANSNLYSTTRMLLSLARSGYAPRPLATVGATASVSRGWPWPAPECAPPFCWRCTRRPKAFLALYGTAVAGMLFIWVVILITFPAVSPGAARGSAVAVADQDAGAPSAPTVGSRR
jgi:L-asparagine transporter-like permease